MSVRCDSTGRICVKKDFLFAVLLCSTQNMYKERYIYIYIYTYKPETLNPK